MDRQERDFKGIWIPRDIWLSKELSLQEKVFLVEIDSLDNHNGCYAGNQYFAEFFGISKTRVSLVIKSLQEKGFVKSTLIYKDGTKQILNRVLNICYTPLFNESYRPSLRKVIDPTQGKLKGNNTINNTINNIIEEKEIAAALSQPQKNNRASNKPKKQTKEELYQIKFEQPLKDGEVRHHKYDECIIKAPAIDEVKSYFLNILGSTENLAEQFYLNYDSTNWKAGATKIINWKSKASLWVNNNKIYEAKNKSSKKIEVNKTKADERYFELNGGKPLF